MQHYMQQPRQHNILTWLKDMNLTLSWKLVMLSKSAAQKRLQKQAGEKIGQMDNVIVDTHASILTPSGYLPGLPEWTVKAIMPNTIVLVEALPEEIENRRSKDTSRARDKDDIGLHQRINREYAIAAAFMTGATVGFVPNNDNKIEIAVEKFKEILNI